MENFEKIVEACVGKLNKELPYVDMGWGEIVDYLGLDMHPDNLRKMAYGYKQYYEYLQKREINNIDSDELKKINEKLIELKKERTRLADLRTEINKQTREQARFEQVLEMISDGIDKLAKAKPLKNNKTIRIVENERKECLICLSDLHYGIKIDNEWNKFDSDIAKSRMDYIVDKAIEFGRLHNCDIANIIITGDVVNNNNHLSSRMSNRECIAEQVVGVSELISNAIQKLSNSFAYVSISMCEGNHDRIYANKSDNDYNDSFIHIIRSYIKARIENLSNVIFTDNKHGNDIVEINVCNKKIVAVHGDKISQKSLIPRLTSMFGKVDYVIRGHVHTPQSETFGESTLVTVGTFSGVDMYARQLGLICRPSQKIIILSSNSDDEIVYNVDLSKIRD